MDRIVVVGAGMAGVNTAVALREQGWNGPLVVLGEEVHAPYDRPPLSKEVLAGKAEHSAFDIDFAELGIELLLGRRALALDPAARSIATSEGPVGYERLVLASGAEPIGLPGTAGLAELPEGVHQLRTFDNALALRAQLRPGHRVVIVGAGWIGAETATVARALGSEVTVLEAAEEPLAGALPEAVLGHFRRWYAEAGVELRTGVRVAGIESAAGSGGEPGEGPAGVVRLRLAPGAGLPDGGELAAEAVLVGIGVRPATGWLLGSGIELDERGAVRADEYLRTSLPEVWAVGDCASFPSARYRTRLLVNHWDNALQGARAVAAGVLGGEVRYDPVPYFWSEQFGRFVQYAGRYEDADEMLWRGLPGKPDGPGESWTVLWLREGRLVAMLAVDRPRDLVQGRKLMLAGARLDRVRAAEPGVQLKAAVA